MSEQVLIATLGSEPQVVTLALALLRAQGYSIAAVKVVHTMDESVQAGLKILDAEFKKGVIRDYQAVPIESGGWSVSDVANEQETVALLRTLYRVVLAEKRVGRLVHLSIAGGRKIMAAYGMVVAQLLFDDDDRLWHVLSGGWQPGNERVMHPRPGDAVSLLPVPVLRWSPVSPLLENQLPLQFPHAEAARCGAEAVPSGTRRALERESLACKQSFTQSAGCEGTA